MITQRRRQQRKEKETPKGRVKRDGTRWNNRGKHDRWRIAGEKLRRRKQRVKTIHC